MKFLCNLGARRCNLGLPMEQSADGDEIVLIVPGPLEDLGEMVADDLRWHLRHARKDVAVLVKAVPPAILREHQQEAAQRAAQRA